MLILCFIAFTAAEFYSFLFTVRSLEFLQFRLETFNLQTSAGSDASSTAITTATSCAVFMIVNLVHVSNCFLIVCPERVLYFTEIHLRCGFCDLPLNPEISHGHWKLLGHFLIFLRQLIVTKKALWWHR